MSNVNSALTVQCVFVCLCVYVFMCVFSQLCGAGAGDVVVFGLRWQDDSGQAAPLLFPSAFSQ